MCVCLCVYVYVSVETGLRKAILAVTEKGDDNGGSKKASLGKVLPSQPAENL